MSCSYCGKEIYVGDRVFGVENYGEDKVFCSRACARMFIESKADEIANDLIYEDEFEEDSRYEDYL